MSDYTTMSPDEAARTLKAEERELDFRSFTLADAWQVGSGLQQRALREEWPLVTAIVLGGQRVFRAAAPGSSADNEVWLARKFRVVEQFGMSSLGVRYSSLARGRPFEDDPWVDQRELAAHGGAFPLRIGGTLAGVIGVSGLEMHVDHALVVDALRTHLRRSEPGR